MRWPLTPQKVDAPSRWPAGAHDSVDLPSARVAPPFVISWNVASTVAPLFAIELLTRNTWPSCSPATGWNFAPLYCEPGTDSAVSLTRVSFDSTSKYDAR